MYVVAGVVLVTGYILAFIILPLAVKVFLAVTTPAPRQNKIKAGAVLSPPRTNTDNAGKDNAGKDKQNRDKKGVDLWA